MGVSRIVYFLGISNVFNMLCGTIIQDFPAIHITKLPYSFWQFHFYLCRSPSLLNNPIQIDSHSNLFFDQIQPLPDPWNLFRHHESQMAGLQRQIL